MTFLNSKFYKFIITLIIFWRLCIPVHAEGNFQSLAENNFKNSFNRLNTCPDIKPAKPFKTIDQSYQQKYHSVTHELLNAEHVVKPVTDSMLLILDTLIDEAIETLSPYPHDLEYEESRTFAEHALHQIDCILLRHGFVYPGRGAVQLLSDGLTPIYFEKFSDLNEVYRHSRNIRRREFINAREYGPFYIVDCDIASLLYLAIGEVMGYPLSLVDIPNHIFVRWELGKDKFINFETMDGFAIDNQYYIKNWSIPVEFINYGGTLHSMTKTEVKAYHFAVIAEAYSWQHEYAKMLDYYFRSIQLDKTRAFALNNIAWYYIALSQAGPDFAKQAIYYAKKAVNTFPSGDHFDTLACAYAEAQNFKNALIVAKKAEHIRYAPLESDIQGDLQRFERKQHCEYERFGHDLKPYR